MNNKKNSKKLKEKKKYLITKKNIGVAFLCINYKKLN